MALGPGPSFDLDGSGVSLIGDALPVAVYTYAPDEGYSLLPNVKPIRVDRVEGCVPSAARFAYRFDTNLSLTYGWPARIEEVFGLAAPPNPYAVYPDQRLVILARNPDGSPWVLWDGFAQVPQAVLSGRSERVLFTGIGVEVRLWDRPISGAVWRDSDPKGIVDTSGASDVRLGLRCAFNASDGYSVGALAGPLPNCSPLGYDTGAVDDPDNAAPVFVDAGVAARGGQAPPRYWTLSGAVRYLLRNENDQQYVQNPPFPAIDTAMRTVAPAKGRDTIDPSDPSSYQFVPIQVPECDYNNQPLPEAVQGLIALNGFLARFNTYTDGDGAPATVIDFYRRDEMATVAPKSVYLQAATGDTVDPTLTNVCELDLSMDVNGIVNAYEVETDQRRIEISWILAPLYKPASADASAAGRRKFQRSNSAGQTASYRRYGADETGDGHWTADGQWSTLPCDFEDLFPPDKDTGDATFAYRYRPGSATLISTDDDGRPQRADLSISFDYQGPTRVGWDGSGTWTSITGGWKLLPDRLGIEVTAEDPEMWTAAGATADTIAAAGGGAAVASQLSGGVIRGITWWANPPTGAPTNGKMPTLRLTTVIDDDMRMPISADKRIASPTTFARTRTADRRDMYQYGVVDLSSMNYADLIHRDGVKTNDLVQIVVRDDTDAARGLAEQLRGDHEMPVLAGRVRIPGITDYYQVGDRISSIDGRDCLLQTNVAVDQGEAPTYPWVVGVSWEFDPHQYTVLTLSDKRALPRTGGRHHGH